MVHGAQGFVLFAADSKCKKVFLNALRYVCIHQKRVYDSSLSPKTSFA